MAEKKTQPKKQAKPALKSADAKKPVKKAEKKPVKDKETTVDEKPKKGRPEIYSQEIADILCAEIATSNKSLRTICDQEGMPSVTSVLKWLREDKNDFSAQYARAKEEQADLLVEDILDIADHTDEDHTPFTGGNVVQRDRLRVESRKWIASKLKPKKYGDKLDVTNTNRTIIVEAPTDEE